MRIFKFHLNIFFCLIALGLFTETAIADVDFDKLYGSDLGMGIGARAIGLGGAFVAIADDASGVYWNPAGLTDVNTSRLFLSAEAPSDFSAAAIIYSPGLPIFQAMDMTFGFSYVRRLRFRGDSNDGNWNGYPSHLLDLAMVDVGEDFSGKINSKTCDTRISLAFSPFENKKLSFGLNYIFLK